MDINNVYVIIGLLAGISVLIAATGKAGMVGGAVIIVGDILLTNFMRNFDGFGQFLLAEIIALGVGFAVWIWKAS